VDGDVDGDIRIELPEGREKGLGSRIAIWEPAEEVIESPEIFLPVVDREEATRVTNSGSNLGSNSGSIRGQACNIAI
jgi:hypothetical protein